MTNPTRRAGQVLWCCMWRRCRQPPGESSESQHQRRRAKGAPHGAARLTVRRSQSQPRSERVSHGLERCPPERARLQHADDHNEGAGDQVVQSRLREPAVPQHERPDEEPDATEQLESTSTGSCAVLAPRSTTRRRRPESAHARVALLGTPSFDHAHPHRSLSWI